MALCEFLIAADVALDCDNPIFAGLEQTGYIINKSDIASFTKAGGIVSALTLADGAKAYHIYQAGKQPFNGTTTDMQEGDIMNTMNKTVAFMVLENSPSVSENIIKPLLNGEFVVVVENKYKDDDKQNAFEVFGLDKGCRANAVSQNKYENMAAWSVTMVESETPNPSTFFWVESSSASTTDYAATKAALEALTA